MSSPRSAAPVEVSFGETLLDSLAAGILCADSERNVSYGNRAAWRTLGVTPQSALGRPLAELLGPGVLAELETLAPGTQRRVNLMAPERVPPLDLGLTLLRPVDTPASQSTVIAFRDLSELRDAELELRRAERLTALGHLLAGFAHEVRNPVAGLQGLVEVLMADTPSDDPRREPIERMQGLVSRVERFLRAALSCAQPEPAHPRRVDARDLARAVVATGALRGRGHGRGPQLMLEDEPALVLVDREQVEMALLAGLQNAVEATGDPERVALLVERGAEVRLLISDDGPGIAPGLLPQVFDPLVTTKPQAVGLGLALVQSFVRGSRGRVALRSRPGRTELELAFPAVTS